MNTEPLADVSIGRELFYRVRVDIDESAFFSNPCNIDFITFEVAKHTPCGVWIRQQFRTYWSGTLPLLGPKKFVNLTCNKKYAYPTKKEALDDFIQRREKYIPILESRLTHAKDSLDAAKRLSKTFPTFEGEAA